VHKTNMHQILVRILQKDETPFEKEIRETSIRDLSTTEAVQGEIAASSIHDVLNIDSSRGEANHDICLARRETLLALTSSMSKDSIHFGVPEHGVLAKKAGSVVHLFKGTLMQARIRTNVNGECCTQIPITIDVKGVGVELFADPDSKIIVENCTSVVCSTHSPMFYADGEWFCNEREGPRRCTAPTKMSPQLTHLAKAKAVSLGWLGMSMYGQKSMQDLHHFQQANWIHEAHISNISHSYVKGGNTDAHLNTINSWGEKTTAAVMSKMHPNLASIFGRYALYGLEIVVLIILSPLAVYLAILFVRIMIVCFGQGCSQSNIKKALTNIFKLFRASSDKITKEFKDSLLTREEAMVEIRAGDQNIEASLEASNRVINDLKAQSDEQAKRILVLEQEASRATLKMQNMSKTLLALKSHL
jgi:hypothetical protein